MDTHAMPEPVTQGQFFAGLDDLRRHIDSKHSSLGGRLDDRFDRLDAKLTDHKVEDDKVADRVLIIETEREVEQKQAVRTSTWVALVVSGGLTVVWQLLAKAWKG